MVSAAFSSLVICSCNTIAMELLTRSAGNASFSLLTFATFLFMSADGFIRHPELIKRRHIPMISYIPIIIIFFLVSIGNNRVLGYPEIPFILVIVFRSGTLVTNVLLTWLLQNRRYSFGRIFSVMIITAGIVLFTMSSNKYQEMEYSIGQIPLFFVGILIMCLTMFASAYLGILQEKIFMLYGKHPDEMMFFVHLLSLPFFTPFGTEIKRELVECLNAPALWIGSILPLPMLFISLFSSVILQYICIRSVYQLTAELNSLQVTMILTLRKFLNISLSVLIFKNEFGIQHLISTIMVLAGTFTFYDGHNKFWEWTQKRSAEAKKKIL